jgi:electron transport complex protein RnfB
MPYTITEQCNGCGACVRICPAEAITGVRKKLHVIDAGSCIECGACGRVCPEDSVMDASGAICTRVKKSDWPKPQFNLRKCLACIICIEACPVGCLGFTGRLGSGALHNYPYLENAGRTCIGCGFCATSCPVDAITMSA